MRPYYRDKPIFFILVYYLSVVDYFLFNLNFYNIILIDNFDSWLEILFNFKITG